MKRHPVAICLVGLLLMGGKGEAADVARNLTVTDLSNGTAWVGGSTPTSNDVALWTAGSRNGGSTNNQLSSSVSWQGVASDAGFTSNVTINTANGSTLTLGSAGINLEGTGGAFTFTLPTVILEADQTWISNSGRQLVMTSALDIGNTLRTISIGNPDAASTTNKIVINNVFGGSNSSLTLLNANPSLTPQVWIQLVGAAGTGIQTDLTIGSGVLAYYNSQGSIASTSNLTVSSGGVLDVSTKSTGLVSQTVASLSGSGTITNNRSNASTNTLIVSNTSGISTFSGSFVNGIGAINLTKEGASVFVLDGTNTSSGTVTATEGVLRLNSAGAFSANGNLYLNGGVVELGVGNSSFTRALGSSANQVRLTGGGGFGAYGADATVTLTGAFTWGGGNFASAGQNFVLSSNSSTHKVTIANDIDLGATSPTRTIEVRNGGAAIDAEISGVIKNGTGGGNNGSVIKTGSGALALSNVNTYTGSTVVNAGTLILSGTGTVNTTSGITVSGAGSELRYDSSVGLTRNVGITNGGRFAYNSAANYSGALTFTSGELGGTNWNGNLGGLSIGADRIITPGNSVGTASTTTQTWAELGTYDWEINKADGTAGLVSGGWDLVNLTGSLNLTSTSGNRFTINIISLGLDNLPGLADGWDANTSYAWLIADAGSSISGFSADLFAINDTAFGNAKNGTFGVVLGDTILGGNDSQIYITYSAIPEPGTTLLVGLGLGGVLYGFRRRRA